MKIHKSLFLMAVLLSCVFLTILSCNLQGDSPVLELFSQATELVAPHFQESNSRMGFGTDSTTWGAGNAIYELYGILNTEDDMYGYFNLHMQMDSADQSFSSGVDGGIDAVSPNAGTLVAPFEVSLTDNAGLTYETQYESDSSQILIADSTAQKAMAYANFYTDPDNNSKNMEAVKAAYNEGTGALEIISVKMNDVTYETPNRLEFCKVYLKGNSETNTFFFKLTLHDVNSDDSANFDRGTLIGYGISEGADNYFLFKIISDGSSRYIRFEADSDKADLQAIVAAASGTLGLSSAEVTSAIDPEGYKATVDAVDITTDTFFDWSGITNTSATYSTYHGWTADDLLLLF